MFDETGGTLKIYLSQSLGTNWPSDLVPSTFLPYLSVSKPRGPPTRCETRVPI